MTNFVAPERSIIFNPWSFSFYLYRNRSRIWIGCEREDVSLETYKKGILQFISKAKPWDAKVRFEQDIKKAKTKQAVLDRCEHALKRAAEIPRY